MTKYKIVCYVNDPEGNVEYEIQVKHKFWFFMYEWFPLETRYKSKFVAEQELRKLAGYPYVESETYYDEKGIDVWILIKV